MTVNIFSWVDYVVFVSFLVLSALIGVLFGYLDRKKMSSKNFLLGGGDLPWYAVALSMQASFISAIFILSVPVEVYNWGTMYFYFCLSYFISMPISAHFFLVIYYRLNVTSAYEYMEMRFNRTVRTVCAVIFCLQNLLYMSVVLYSPALAFSQVSGLSVLTSVIMCGLVCTFYTFLGGMKGTVWNDFIQMMVIAMSLIVMMVMAVLQGGGMDKVWQSNDNAGRIVFDDFRVDPTIRTTFWTQAIGGNFIILSQYASSQTTIQKFLSVKTLRGAQKAIYLMIFTTLFFFILVCIFGLGLYAIYEGCDPLMSGQIEKSDQLVSFFVMDVLGHLSGVPGLFVASIFMAALSSISGSLNALSAVTLTDFLQPAYKGHKKVEMSEKMKNIISRSLILVYGVLITFLGFSAQFFGDVMVQVAFSIFGFVGGPLTSVIALGMFFPFINSWGALVGLVTSLVIATWVALGAIISGVSTPLVGVNADSCPHLNFTDSFTTPTTFLPSTETEDDILWIYKVSFMYYGGIAMIVCFSSAIIVSLITGKNTEVDSRLMVDWYSFFPAKMASFLQCNVTYLQKEGEDNLDETTANEETLRKIDSHNEINIYIKENDLKDDDCVTTDIKKQKGSTIEPYLNDNITAQTNGGEHINVVTGSYKNDNLEDENDSKTKITFF